VISMEVTDVMHILESKMRLLPGKISHIKFMDILDLSGNGHAQCYTGERLRREKTLWKELLD
jgi:hypothetical protein